MNKHRLYNRLTEYARLQDHPDVTITVDELSRETGINRAEIHAHLNAMIRDGWLLRRSGHGGVANVYSILPLVKDAAPMLSVFAERLGLDLPAANALAFRVRRWYLTYPPVADLADDHRLATVVGWTRAPATLRMGLEESGVLRHGRMWMGVK